MLVPFDESSERRVRTGQANIAHSTFMRKAHQGRQSGVSSTQGSTMGGVLRSAGVGGALLRDQVGQFDGRQIASHVVVELPHYALQSL